MLLILQALLFTVFSRLASVCLSSCLPHSLADLTKVCDIAEDKAYILKKCSELRTKCDQLVKMNRFTLRPYTFPTIYRYVLSRAMELRMYIRISITYA